MPNSHEGTPNLEQEWKSDLERVVRRTYIVNESKQNTDEARSSLREAQETVR